MPRTSIVTVNEAIAALKKYADYFTEPELPKYTSEVWTNISKELKGKWNPHSIYINVREDRRKILTLMRKELGIYLPDKNNNSANYSLTDTSAEKSALDITKDIIDNDPDFKKKPDFLLVIKTDIWRTIKPKIPVEYKDRKYLILEPKVWTHTIFHQFWKQYRLPCAYDFKRAKVHPSPESEHYIIIHGKCTSKQCSNKFIGYVEKEPDENVDVIIEIHTRDTSTDAHEIVKRPLAGIQRCQVSKEIVAEGCSNWRKKIAREEMDFGDVEPPILYKADVLRQAKKERIEKDLGVGKIDGRDIVRAIEEMMVTSPYTGSVQAVGSNPFYTFYRSQVQVHVYKEYLRLRKDSACISIDATGSIVQALPRGLNKSGHIFLYAIVINFDGCSVSVNQMLSEKNETEFIEFWLKQWIRQVPKPPEVVSDYSRALLCAFALAFNNQTIKSYINLCFSFLMEKSESTSNLKRLVATFIRVDVAHLIHLVTRWKCFTAIRQLAIKDFYVRCVALMVDCQTFSRLEEIYLLTSIVALHPHNGVNSAATSDESAKSARKKLENYIAVGCLDANEILQKIDLNEKHDAENDVYHEDEPIGKIEEWVKKMQSIAENGIEHEAGELNAFYLPDFFKHLQQLIKEFPLWTGVMIPHFNSKHEHASSSYCEGNFNDLKTRVMTKFGKPLRADKFLKMHLQDLNGGANIFSSKLICYRMTNQVSSNRSKLSEEHKINAGTISCENEGFDDLDLMSVENWRNKGSKVQPIGQMQEDILELNLLKDEEFGTSQVCSTGSPSKTNEVELSEDNHENTCLGNFCSELVNPNTIESTSPVQNFVSAQDESPEAIKRRSKYFRPFPEITLKNKLSLIKKAYLLKNGNISNPIPTEKVKMAGGKMVQRKLMIKNTCVFDSIVQVLLTSALDCSDYKSIIEKSNNETLQFVLKFMENGPNLDVLKSRAMLLKPLYSATITPVLEVGGITVIEASDALDNITNLWDKLLHSEPSAYTTQECSNESCPTKRTGISFLAINHTIIAQNGFNSLQKAVQFNSYVKSSKCKNGDCLGRSTISQRENYHLFIELDVRINVASKNGIRCKLKEFPNMIQLSQQNFKLRGVVGYNPGHYIAYCKRLDGHWELYNDTAPSVKPVTSNTEIEPHAAVYTKVS